MYKTIAVTGANGHIGNVVCRQLLEKGYKVKALYNSNKKSLEGLPIETVEGNVLDPSALTTLINGCDAVIHCAAIISIHGDPNGIVFKTNTEGPANVLAVSKKLGVKKIIHLSSTHAVCELPHADPFNEKRPYKTSKDYVYDFSKACGEQIMLEGTEDGRIEVVVLRPSSVLGPFDFKPSELGKALLDFYKEKIPALPAGGYDFVDVRDVANSIVAALEKGNNKEVYLVTGKYYSLIELAQVVHTITGKKTPRRSMSYGVLKSLLPLISFYSKLTGAAPLFTIESIDALKNGHPNMDHSKAALQLGHKTRPLEETIRDFYTWQKTANKI